MTKAVLPSIRDAEFFDLLTRVFERMLYVTLIMDQSEQEYSTTLVICVI